MKKERIVALLILLVMLGNQVFAIESMIKSEENVYVNVDAYGNVEKVNIYHEYQFYGQEKLVEYGDYTKFQVLSGNIEPKVSGDEIEWQVSGEKNLSYLAETDLDKANQLPWKFQLTYFLNGVETSASELPGKAGLVKVKIEILPNLEAPEYYRNNYMLEITGSFDMTNYLSVFSEDATEVMVGKTKQLMFIILPGEEKTVEIEIGTDNFEMDGLTFAMVPLQGEILEVVENLAKDKNDMEDAMDQSNQSLSVILTQMSNMTKQLNTIIEGTEALQGGIDAIHENSAERNENIVQLKNNLLEIDTILEGLIEDIQYAIERVEDTDKTIREVNELLKNLTKVVEEFEKDCDALIDMAEDLPDDILILKNAVVDTKNMLGSLKKMMGDYDSIREVDLEAVAQNLRTVGANTQYMGEEAYKKLATGEGDTAFCQEVLELSQEMGESLEKVQSELKKAEEIMGDGNESIGDLTTDISKLQKDLNKLADVLEDFSEDCEDLPDSIETFQDSLKTMRKILNLLTQSIDENQSGDKDEMMNLLGHAEQVLVQLKNLQAISQSMLTILESELSVLDQQIRLGTNQTVDGTQELLKTTSKITQESGTLKQAKDTIYTVVKNNLDDLEGKTTLFEVDASAEVKSIASEKNLTPEKVQIFVKTASLKKENKKEVVDLEPKKEKVGLLTKIKNVLAKIWSFITNLFIKG